MAWIDIAKAFANRLKMVPNIGIVHDYIAETDEAPNSTKWNAMYVSGGQVRFWTISRTPTAIQWKLSEDDDKVYVGRGIAEIHGHVSYMPGGRSEHQAAELFDKVVEAFRDADRTLGGAINTHSLPEVLDVDPVVNFEGVTCHQLVIRIAYEVIKVVTVTEEDLAEPVITVGQSFQASKIAQGLVDFITPRITAVTTKVRVSRHTRRDLSEIYPANPRTDCDRVTFVLENDETGPSVAQAGYTSEFTVQGSFWIQLRQTPGQDHHKRLSNVVDAINACFLGHFQPGNLTGIEGLTIYTSVPKISNFYPDQQHDFEDPAMRISIARMQVHISGRTRTLPTPS